jgi:LacI family transcriptional regulator
MTVSNVVNGRFDQVSSNTRLLVERAIQRLGYRPHSTGRHLRLSHQFSVGMVVIDDSPTFLADPFITQVVAGLSNFLNKRDYALVLQGATPGQLRSSSLFRRQMTDAICVMLSGQKVSRHAMVKELLALGHPLILFQEKFRANDLLQVIRQDDFGGVKDLTSHLLRRGTDSIWLLIPSLEWPAIVERQKGIRAAIAHAHCAVRLEVIQCGDGSFAATANALSKHSKGRKLPRAIMGGNDQMGIAALKWLQSKGVRTPEDVFVTGYNAFESWEYTTPTLTSVFSPAYEMGARASKSILTRLQVGKFERSEFVLPVKLRLGGSA